MNTTWWRTHPVGHRLLAVLVLEVVLAVLPLAVTGRGLGGLLWLALDVWLVSRVRRSSGVAWLVLLGFSVLGAGLGVLSLVAVGPGVPAVASTVLNAVVVGLLLTPTVRGWVGRSGLMSLPGEH